MITLLHKTSRAISALNEGVGKVISWLTLILVIVFCIDVVQRYLFNVSKVWIGELEWHLFALIFLLGAGYAFKHDKHVRVDVFYSNYSEKGKAWVNLIGGLIFLVPWTVLVIWVSYKYAFNSFSMGEGSPNPGGLPARYVIKFSIVLGLFLLLLQGLANLIDSLIIILNKQNDIVE